MSAPPPRREAAAPVPRVPEPVRIRRMDGPDAGTDTTFSTFPVVVGAGAACDFTVAPEGDAHPVRERHCELFDAAGALHVRTIDADAEASLNEEPLAGPTPIRSGDQLRLGPNGPRILLHLGGDTFETAQVSRSRSAETPPRFDPDTWVLADTAGSGASGRRRLLAAFAVAALVAAAAIVGYLLGR